MVGSLLFLLITTLSSLLALVLKPSILLKGNQSPLANHQTKEETIL
jgi:hypothetical protein